MEHTIEQSLYFCTISKQYILASNGTFDDSPFMVFVQHEPVIVKAPSIDDASELCEEIYRATQALRDLTKECQV